MWSESARTDCVIMLYDGAALIFSIENSHLVNGKLWLSAIKASEERWGIKMGSFCVSKNLDYTNLHFVGGRIAQISKFKITTLFCFFFKQLQRFITSIKTCNEFRVRSIQTSFIMSTVCFNHVLLPAIQRQVRNSIWYCEREKKTFTLSYNAVC